MKQETRHPARTRLMRVKSPSDILKTLDDDGKLDGLPFMPEMVAYCGTCIRVHRSARRTCVVGHGFREMKDAVFLQDTRCDGSFHDRCHRACLLFWKNAWLAPAGSPAIAQPEWSAHDVVAAARLRRLPTRDGARYVCQSTALESATTALHRWDVRPLLREILARELSLSDFGRILVRTLWRRARGGKQEQLAGVPGAKSRGNLNLRGRMGRHQADRSAPAQPRRKREELRTGLSADHASCDRAQLPGRLPCPSDHPRADGHDGHARQYGRPRRCAV
jgi:hypothetical protein